MWKYRFRQPADAHSVRSIVAKFNQQSPRLQVIADVARQELLDSLHPNEAACLEAARAILEARARRGGQSMASPWAAAELAVLHLGGLDHERFAVAFLDSQLRLISFDEMFIGTLAQTSVHPREVVRRALHHNAHSVILAHNHPSGTLSPSRADETLTQALQDALALIEVRVVDHIIVGAGQSFSFADRGLI